MDEIYIGIIAGAIIVVVVFTAIGIVVAVKTKCCRKAKEDSALETQNNFEEDLEGIGESPDRQLIDEGDDGVSITLANILDSDIWIDDMAGVMNHCIPILKACHDLTSRLVPITAERCGSEEDSKKIENVALEVQPRLDDVVQLLEGPLDPRLIEARCTALYYAVSNLCLVIKGVCKEADDISTWIDGSLHDIESHLKVLQAETQKLYKRSVSDSIRERGGTEPSPVYELALTATHSSSSSSHTDSAESGIDLETPSEGGSQHSPQSPSYQSVMPNHSKNVAEEGGSKESSVQHGLTVVEVHAHKGQSEDAIEMSSFDDRSSQMTS